MAKPSTPTFIVCTAVACLIAFVVTRVTRNDGRCPTDNPPGATSIGTITFEAGATALYVRGDLSLESEATSSHPHQWRVKSPSGVDLTVNPAAADPQQTSFKNNNPQIRAILSGGVPAAANKSCSLKLNGPREQVNFIGGGTLRVSI